MVQLPLQAQRSARIARVGKWGDASCLSPWLFLSMPSSRHRYAFNGIRHALPL
jgi:hypothetical protein